MDHPFEYDLVCIGAGAAGRHAALLAGEIGKRVAVIEKERTLLAERLERALAPVLRFLKAKLRG